MISELLANLSLDGRISTPDRANWYTHSHVSFGCPQLRNRDETASCRRVSTINVKPNKQKSHITSTISTPKSGAVGERLKNGR